MSAETISETLQENADMMRVLKAGLRTHDPETVDSAFLRIVKKYGENIATNVVMDTITLMISKENWSWFDKDDNPSPLLYHTLPSNS